MDHVYMSITREIPNFPFVEELAQNGKILMLELVRDCKTDEDFVFIEFDQEMAENDAVEDDTAGDEAGAEGDDVEGVADNTLPTKVTVGATKAISLAEAKRLELFVGRDGHEVIMKCSNMGELFSDPIEVKLARRNRELQDLHA